ncbi:nidogen-1 [Polypterus senegalus]|uniref:nidogen-1 n=1 Tax=Polypterus senegalus TaxID=55291 RepID=UPI001966622E|nr:nidogen-1 [Polypterus senegalus]
MIPQRWVLMAGLLVVALAALAQGLSRSELFPYGEQFGDTSLDRGDESTAQLFLKEPLHFYDGTFSSVYVVTNGIISTSPLTDKNDYINVFPTSFGSVAPFLADLDISDGIGKVYFREDSSPESVQQAAEHINRAFPEDELFYPKSTVIVTWENVAAHQDPENENPVNKKRNTFQAVLASSDNASFAIFLYPEDGIQFYESKPQSIHNRDNFAKAGFSKGKIQYFLFSRNGPFYEITSNSEESVKELCRLTNSGRQGVWVYEIGSFPFFTDIAPGEVSVFLKVVNNFPTEGTLTGDHQRNDVEVTEIPNRTQDSEETVPKEDYIETHNEGQGPKYVQPLLYEISEDVPSDKQSIVESNPPVDELPVHSVQFQTNQRQSYPPLYPEVVIVEDDIEVNGNVFPYNIGPQETCANSQQTCSVFADCRDYSTGYCCYCRPGFYGNGKQCIAEGKPQRVNGKVNGAVYVGNNPNPLWFSNNDLHSYVVANDGRAYVAISAIPQELGPSLMPLSSIGGIIGWTFALEQPGYENGFSSIGGEFTRTAEVTFLPGNEKLTIKQEFKGIDEHDHLVLSTVLDGRLPDIPVGATVQIEPYTEIYYYGSSVITSSSIRDYTVTIEDTGVQKLSYQWKQKIIFQSCRHDEATRSMPATQQLNVDTIFVLYDASNQIIRYAMSNKIGTISSDDDDDQNPCYTGTHNCDTNAACRPGLVKQFTCECAAGFRGNGYTCYDADECQDSPNICGNNAVCNNLPGTFRCECLSGYQFAPDGHTCIDIDECQPNRCHNHATCYNTPGSFSCQCKPGYRGNGFQCIPQEQEKTPCQLHRDRILGVVSPRGPRPVPGQYIPVCDDQGNYRPLQCHGSTGQCWCVDRNGQEIQGTRTQPGIRPPCIDPGVPPTPVGPTPRPGVHPLPPGTHLLFAQSGKIDYVPLEGHNMKKSDAKTVLHLPDKVVIAVAYDCVDKMVYWTDITGPSISRALLSGGEPISVIKTDIESPEGIAVDYLGRNLFWTDSMLDKIEVSKLDGSQRRVLFDTDLVNPRAIVTDPVKGHIYWTDWNREAPKIETAYMDGTNRRVIVKTDLALPNGLTYDPYSLLLCWVDAGTQRVECMNPNQTGRRKVLEGIQYPFGITSYGKNLYYTDWRRDAVISVERTVGKELDAFLPQKRSRLYGITTAYSQCPPGQNYCTVNNGGCTHLCLATPAGRTCRCPDTVTGVGCLERDSRY